MFESGAALQADLGGFLGEWVLSDALSQVLLLKCAVG